MSSHPLFVIGNKRSGSSLLVRLLNLHPRILVTHEADIAWILYQLVKKSGTPLRPHPLDEAKGMDASLAHHEEVLAALLRSQPVHRAEVRRAFDLFYDRVNRLGRGNWDPAAQKDDLAWIGDKKPVQHADPAIFSFLETSFPDARYLHVVRDPRYVVASMREAARTWNDRSVPPHWRGSTRSIFRRWLQNEERVQAARTSAGARLKTVPLEALAADPVDRMSEVFAFLDLPLPTELGRTIEQSVWSTPNGRHEPADLGPISKSEQRLIESYGYRRSGTARPSNKTNLLQ